MSKKTKPPAKKSAPPQQLQKSNDSRKRTARAEKIGQGLMQQMAGGRY